MISSILLDMGGTLDSDGVHWLDRFYDIYSRQGMSHLPKALIKEAFYWADEQADLEPAMKTAGLRDMVERHVRWQFQKLGIENTGLEAQVSEAFWRPCERVMRRNRHILERLHFAGLKLGLISNFYGNIEVLCREFGYTPFLTTVLDSAVCGLKKPDPRVFQLALDGLGTTAAETAFVGDSFERDIVPAKAIGMTTFWLVGDHPRNAPAEGQVDAVLKSLEDLPERIAELRAGSAA
jgi:putative hydrolase of the HAD superfamily